MKMYVGVTDYDWYTILKENKCEEVNFWTPGATPFKAIQNCTLLLPYLTKPYQKLNHSTVLESMITSAAVLMIPQIGC